MMFGNKKIAVNYPTNITKFCIKINDVDINEVEYTKFLGILLIKN